MKFVIVIKVWLLVMSFNKCATMSQAIFDSRSSTSDLPLYWGWFIDEEDSTSFLLRSRKILADTLQVVPEFLKDAQNFTNHQFISDILSHYSREQPDEVLHCTTMYNGVSPDYSPGAQEYADKNEVKEKVDKKTVIHSIGWIFTRRTFGARLYLTEDQLLLWNQDDTEGNPPTQRQRKSGRSMTIILDGDISEMRENTTQQEPDILGNFQPTSGKGSRAHLTLGCAPNVSAVTTGWDLVDLIKLEIANSSSVKTYDLPDGGWLRNYGDGQWVIYPDKQWLLEAQFQGYSSSAINLNSSFSLLLLSCILTLLALFLNS